jgi:hypothetical protein
VGVGVADGPSESEASDPGTLDRVKADDKERNRRFPTWVRTSRKAEKPPWATSIRSEMKYTAVKATAASQPHKQWEVWPRLVSPGR